jgi:hypothetical protein
MNLYRRLRSGGHLDTYLQCFDGVTGLSKNPTLAIVSPHELPSYSARLPLEMLWTGLASG